MVFAIRCSGLYISSLKHQTHYDTCNLRWILGKDGMALRGGVSVKTGKQTPFEHKPVPTNFKLLACC